MTKFKLETTSIWENTLPYVIEIRCPDFDPDIDDPSESSDWFATVFTMSEFCLHDINDFYELTNSQFLDLFSLSEETIKHEDHIEIYLYTDENPPEKCWNEYSNRLHSLYKIIDSLSKD